MKRSAASLTVSMVVLATALFLIWLSAFRFVLSNDEGIFLEGALRILHGQAPYRDFFLVMGPGSFWLQALALKILGTTLASSRAIVILDFCILAGCITWIIARRHHPLYAAWVALTAIVIETADPVVALPNHRWDSAALAVLAATILTSEPAWALVLVAGACAAFAAWITPSVALVGLMLIARLAICDRRRLWPFLAGCALITVACASVLAAQHALWPMLQQLLWDQKNYRGVNSMAYGSRFGGYARLFADASGVDLAARGLVVFAITIPAILPPIAAAFLWPQRRDHALQILSLTGAALVLAAYPRMDVPHLAYAAPVFYILLALLAAHIPRHWMRMAAFLAFSLLDAVFISYAAVQHAGQQLIETRVGPIRAAGDDVALIRMLDREIPSGSNFFAFPYLPIAYFLTLGENPTRYSYLQPGMMSDEDESAALAELMAHPPQNILYQDVPESQILEIWPGSDPRRLRLRRIEGYLAGNYQPRATISYGQGSFQILERRDPVTAISSGRGAVQ